MRSTIAIALVLALSACGFLEQIEFNGSSLDPNKIYVGPTNVISVAARETHRYACVGEPMLCVQRRHRLRVPLPVAPSWARHTAFR